MRVAVLGATGSVGRAILQTLDARLFPVQDVIALGSKQSVGREVSMGDTTLIVQESETFDFSLVDLVFSATPTAVAQRLLPRALQAGARVIDKSSAFRMQPDVPLIIPEVNGDLIKKGNPPLIASPNCVVIPLVLALAPLHREARLKRVVVATYQSVSGVGRKGMDELYAQMRSTLMTDIPQKSVFSKQIAFNLIPQIGDIDAQGWTEEETKIREETQKILSEGGKTTIEIAVTAVRVPVFIGHAMAVFAEFEEDLPLSVARSLLLKAPGIEFLERATAAGGVMTPLETVGEDVAFVSRLRKNSPATNSLSFWVTCDNLRKGAALNAVQIAEEMGE